MCKFLHKLFFKRVVVFLVSLMIFMPFGWIASKARLASKDQSLTIKEYYPSLNFSTYLGGGGNDCGSSIDVASDGCCYMTGDTTRDFPTLNAYNETNGGAIDAFVAKISDSGSLLWSTFLGGSGWDSGSCIAVASDGSCYVSGWTSSSNFPTKNAYNSTYGGMKDAFVAKFNSSGSLLWSTFLGGSNSDYGYGIDVDSDGSCYVTGSTTSSNFPTLYAYDSVLDYLEAFITKFSTNGILLWSTYLGGSKNDNGNGIAVASDGSFYVTGRTTSSNFPTLNAYNSTIGSIFCDAFVAKFNASGTLLWSTFLGGSDADDGCSIAVASDGCCYMIGDTWSSNFPTLNAYSSTFGGDTDAFVTKFSASGALLWSTFLGGSESEKGGEVAVASDGSCYVSGWTPSSNFPTLYAYDSIPDYLEAFITKFSTNGILLWSTYLGGSSGDWGQGIAVVNDGSCYVTGSTISSNFPTLNAYDSTYFDNGYQDVFVTKFIQTTTPPTTTQQSIDFGFLVFITALPILVIILRKRRK